MLWFRVSKREKAGAKKAPGPYKRKRMYVMNIV
jgi:hypothetical protein